jgi:hypothetical protein
VRRQSILILACSWLAALVVLLVVRTLTGVPPLVQFLVSLLAWVAIAIPALWRLPGHGYLFAAQSDGSARISRVSLFVAVVATAVVQFALPESWPVVAIGIVLPALSIAQLVISWNRLGTAREVRA